MFFFYFLFIFFIFFSVSRISRNAVTDGRRLFGRKGRVWSRWTADVRELLIRRDGAEWDEVRSESEWWTMRG